MTSSTRGRTVLLSALGGALLVWGCGVAILLLQRYSEGLTYTYWLETTASAVLIAPMALVLATRRPDHRLTWVFCGFVVVDALQLFTGATAAALVSSRHPAAAMFGLAHDTAQMTFVILLMLLVLHYPTGTLMSRRWRPVAWALMAGGLLTAVIHLFVPKLDNFWGIDNPIGAAAAPLPVLQTAGGVLIVAGVVGSVVSCVVRYRRSAGLERLQLKWFTASVVAGLFLLLGLGALIPDDSPIGSVLWTVAPSAVLTSIGLAVARYRLLEIDRIISRTVTYTLISAVLALVYVLTVVVLTPLVSAVRADSTVVVAAATLLVAACFGPVRRRAQALIDRRFNRARYDALRTVASFAGTLRDDVDLEQVADRLVGVVGDTVAPERVLLWLTPPPAEAPAR